jgi:hypothetical protein
MYIDDAINAISILLTKEDESYVLFDLHADNSMTITELVNAAAEIFNINAIINYEKTVPEYIQFYSIDSYMYDRFNFKASISLRQGLLNLYNHVRSIMLYNHEDKKLYREILSSN